jgi:hypothetical protein
MSTKRIFYKNLSTVPITVWGGTTAGHQPRECPEVECGERRIMREREGFQQSPNTKKGTGLLVFFAFTDNTLKVVN